MIPGSCISCLVILLYKPLQAGSFFAPVPAASVRSGRQHRYVSPRTRVAQQKEKEKERGGGNTEVNGSDTQPWLRMPQFLPWKKDQEQELSPEIAGTTHGPLVSNSHEGDDIAHVLEAEETQEEVTEVSVWDWLRKFVPNPLPGPIIAPSMPPWLIKEEKQEGEKQVVSPGPGEATASPQFNPFANFFATLKNLVTLPSMHDKLKSVSVVSTPSIPTLTLPALDDALDSSQDTIEELSRAEERRLVPQQPPTVKGSNPIEKAIFLVRRRFNFLIGQSSWNSDWTSSRSLHEERTKSTVASVRKQNIIDAINGVGRWPSEQAEIDAEKQVGHERRVVPSPQQSTMRKFLGWWRWWGTDEESKADSNASILSSEMNISYETSPSDFYDLKDRPFTYPSSKTFSGDSSSISTLEDIALRGDESDTSGYEGDDVQAITPRQETKWWNLPIQGAIMAAYSNIAAQGNVFQPRSVSPVEASSSETENILGTGTANDDSKTKSEDPGADVVKDKAPWFWPNAASGLVSAVSNKVAGDVAYVSKEGASRAWKAAEFLGSFVIDSPNLSKLDEVVDSFKDGTYTPPARTLQEDLQSMWPLTNFFPNQSTSGTTSAASTPSPGYGYSNMTTHVNPTSSYLKNLSDYEREVIKKQWRNKDLPPPWEEALREELQYRAVNNESLDIDKLTPNQLRRGQVLAAETDKGKARGFSLVKGGEADVEKADKMAKIFTDRPTDNVLLPGIPSPTVRAQSLESWAIMSLSATTNLSDYQVLRREQVMEPVLASLATLHQPTEAMTALSRLVRLNQTLADEILQAPGALDKICYLCLGPRLLRKLGRQFLSRVINVKKLVEGEEQEAALSLLVEMIVASSATQDKLVAMQFGDDLAKALRRKRGALGYSQKAREHCNKVLAALGYNVWKPRVSGQRGLRILALDGGGTRGVLTLRLLQQVLKDTGKEPQELFDFICGTSTGGIIAALLVAKNEPLVKAVAMYDELVTKVFAKTAWLQNINNLIRKQSQYSEQEFEKILEEALKSQRMIDIAGNENAPKLAMVSTIINVEPLQMMIWRSYNYPQGTKAKHEGSFKRMVRECVRATTAAPSIFTPALFNEGVLYCDGALLANNCAAVAIAEAKLAFPNVPIETVVSLGTGFYDPIQKATGEYGWFSIANQIVNSATDTETVDHTLSSLLPRDTYFRLNPRIEYFPIDECRPERLAYLKQRADAYCEDVEVQMRLEELRTILLGNSYLKRFLPDLSAHKPNPSDS